MANAAAIAKEKREAARAEKVDAVVEILEGTLREQLEGMMVEELWDTAQKASIPYTKNHEPRRRADIIEDLLTYEIEKARTEMQQRLRREKASAPPRRTPADPDILEGNTVRLTLEEIALAFSVFLPPNAVVHPTMSRAELYQKTAQRVTPDTVIFTRPDREGNDRQYRLRFKPAWVVDIDKGEQV